MRITSSGFAKFTNTGSHYSVGATDYGFYTNQSGSLTARFYHAGTSNDEYGIAIHTANDQNASGTYFLTCIGSSTVRAEFRTNGGLANYSGNNVNLCDEREKKNIVNLDSTWDCLKHWELKKFHYNEDDDSDDLRYGVIAQQIAPHCPEVITEWFKQKAEPARLDDDGNEVEPAVEEVVRMGVKEQQMMWMAIKALQEAQTRIETLEAANAALEARLTALEGGAS